MATLTLFKDLEPEPHIRFPLKKRLTAGTCGKGPAGETCSSCAHYCRTTSESGTGRRRLMDDREIRIREREIARDKSHKKADIALSIVEWATRHGDLEGEKWKHQRPIDKAVVEAAEAYLKKFLEP